MSADKRKVTTDALETLGTIIEDGGRDAIHLAVEPCVAGEKLYPGQHIGLVGGVAITTAPKKLGIVDPFIMGFVPEGKKFWLVVYPRQITSLRHVWTHPEFDEPFTPMISSEKKESEQWLRNWCENTDDAPTYEDLIGVMSGGPVSQNEGYGQAWINEGDYLLSNGRDAGGEIPLEVWVHVENVIGKKLNSYPSYFSCSC